MERRNDTYKKLKGACGIEGVRFQLDLLTMFLLNTIRHYNGRDWKISSDNITAGKFDDVVFQLANESVLLQSKFKSSGNITRDHLFSSHPNNADFSLPKYFLSYLDIKSEFGKKTAIICTNAKVIPNGLKKYINPYTAEKDNLLHCEGAEYSYSSLTFNEGTVFDLRVKARTYFRNEKMAPTANENKNKAVEAGKKTEKSKNTDKNKDKAKRAGKNRKDAKKAVQNRNNVEKVGGSTKEAEITNKNVVEFLNDFQLFYNYPSGEKLQNNIKRLLYHLDDLWRKTSYNDIYSKIEDWFKQPKGEYLRNFRSSAFLCEIRSDKYCESLREWDVSFTSKHLDVVRSKRIIYVECEGNNLLALLKIYDYLRHDKALFVNPKDPVKMQEEVVETFSFHRYTYLIMVWTAIENQTAESRIIKNIKKILQESEYKNIILISNAAPGLAPFGQQTHFHIDEFVTFQDLTKASQDKLLDKRVIFQGEEITLGELLPRQATEDFTKSLNSAMLEELVRGNQIKVGVNLDKDTVPYYVDRTFKSKIHNVTEENLYNVREKVVVIADSAGTGKSTVLANLSVLIKKNNPELWIIKINLNNYTKAFNTFKEMNKNKINAIELLNSLEATKMNEFETLVFSINKKVVLLLDGVDEISSDCRPLVRSLLSHCQEATNFSKIFVTTKPHLDLKLEVELFKLVPYNKEQQVDFLTSYWIHNLRAMDKNGKEKCKQYATILIEEIFSWAISDIPLHLKFLAEIFLKNNKHEKNAVCESCREYLESGKDEPEIRGKIRISKLCDTFIKKKRDIFINRENPNGTERLTSLFLNQFEVWLDYHRSLAVNTLLPECKQLLNTQIPKDNHTEEYMLRIGIVYNISVNDPFIKKTFAEYFLADSLLRHFKNRYPNGNCQELLTKLTVTETKLNTDEFKNVRAIIGDMTDMTTNISD